MDAIFHFPGGFDLPVAVIVLGLIAGMSYAVLGLGLVLIYKSSRIINLAHGEVGAVSAAALALLVRDHHVPYWYAFVVSVALAGVLGAFVERTFIRRLARAPRLIVLVATVGIAQLFLVFSFSITDHIRNRAGGFPAPFDATVRVGRYLILGPSHVMTLTLVPVVTLALLAFFRYTALGTAVRAAAENAESARLVGIPTRRLSTFVWMLAGILSALTAIMLSPGHALVATEAGSIGPGLLLRALAAAVIGGMTSMPWTFVAGIGIGVVEQAVFWNYPTSGQVELVLFLGILGALLIRSRRRLLTEEWSSWMITHVARPLPRWLQGRRWVGAVNWGGALAFFGAAALLPAFFTNAQTLLLTSVVAFAMLGLSVTILTGYAGQISLGQVGFFGVGAAVSYQLAVQAGVWFWLSLVLSGVVGALASVLIGIPALRIRGLFLAVTTLGFALVAQRWLLGQSWMLGTGVIALRPNLGPIDLSTQRAYYFVALGALALAVWISRNLLRSGVGRNMVAVRENERAAAALAVAPARTKLWAFAISGFIAAFAGAVYGHGIEHFSVNNFPVTDGLRVVSMTIIGGLGSIPGAIMGAIFVIGIDRLVPVPVLRLLTTSVGLLLLLMFLPGGFAHLLYAVRDRLFALLAGRPSAEEGAVTGEARAAAAHAIAVGSHDGDLRAAAADDRVLALREIRVAFGGVVALDGVDLEVPRASIVGLIGPNGAGKTTLLDAVTGFTHPREGRIWFAGRDVTRLRPEARASLGISRSFQDARLFPALTVFQTLLLAQEKADPTPVLAAALSAPAERRRERRRSERAELLIAAMGLVPYRDHLVREISTGTRRILDLACVIVQRPSLLLLDEPSSGIAQREVESLGRLLREVAEATGATMLIVEHDVPLVMGLAQTIVAMDSGRVIAQGPPKEIRVHPAVVESYLGADPTAIERSGPGPTPAPPPKGAAR